jgi:long-chain acyl-CoA synthetase
MDLPILEGYGLTETSPVVAANPPDAPRIGTIGPPVVDTEVRVDEAVTAPVDDAGQVGELLVAGPQVAEEYWNRPEATRDAFEADADGTRWFRTGDVVRLRPDDYVEFVERAKQLLTLSTGKNVAPGPIEDAFATEPLVEQVMVLGEDRKFVGALLVPDVAGVRAWADRRDVSLPADDAALCDDERVRERISRVVDRVNEGFEPHERVKQFRLVPEPFSEENELLTPTMKIRRSNVRERYADEIAAMYGE